MADNTMPPAEGGGNPPDDDIFGRLFGMQEIRCSVDVDPAIEAVEISIHGLPIDYSVVMSRKSAIALVIKVTEAVSRLPGGMRP